MTEKTYQPLGSGPFGRQALGLPDPTSASPASEAPDMEAARRLADSPYRVPPDDSSSLLHVTRHLFWCDEVCKFIRAFQALDKPPSPPNEAVAAALAGLKHGPNCGVFFKSPCDCTLVQAHAAVQELVDRAREDQRNASSAECSRLLAELQAEVDAIRARKPCILNVLEDR